MGSSRRAHHMLGEWAAKCGEWAAKWGSKGATSPFSNHQVSIHSQSQRGGRHLYG